MTEQQAFLAAIIASPEDDLPRLVFADWLDENGQPERAEFIRLQIELAKPAPKRKTHTWGVVQKRYTARLKGMWRAHKVRWFDLHVRFHTAVPLIPTLRLGCAPAGRADYLDGTTIVRRGFVDEIWLTPADCLTGAARVLLHHPVCKIGLAGALPYLTAYNGGSYTWFRDGKEWNAPSDLPPAIFDAMGGGLRVQLGFGDPTHGAYFKKRADAVAAAQAAALKVVRGLAAGLSGRGSGIISD